MHNKLSNVVVVVVWVEGKDAGLEVGGVMVVVVLAEGRDKDSMVEVMVGLRVLDSAVLAGAAMGTSLVEVAMMEMVTAMSLVEEVVMAMVRMVMGSVAG